MDRLVRVDASEVVFRLTLGCQARAVLTLSNVADVDVAYKIKTTAPRRYCVRPNADILPCGTAIDIELLLQAFAEKPPDLHACRDKFQLLVAPLTKNDLRTANAAAAEAATAAAASPASSATAAVTAAAAAAAAVWKSIEPDRIEQKRFKVDFVMDETDVEDPNASRARKADDTDNGGVPQHPRSLGRSLEERFMSIAPVQSSQADGNTQDEAVVYGADPTQPLASIPAVEEAQLPRPRSPGANRLDGRLHYDFVTGEAIAPSEAATAPALPSTAPLPPGSAFISDSLAAPRTPPPTWTAPKSNMAHSANLAMLSPKSAAALAQAPTIIERKLSLAAEIKSAENTPRSDDPVHAVVAGEVDVRSRVKDVDHRLGNVASSAVDQAHQRSSHSASKKTVLSSTDASDPIVPQETSLTSSGPLEMNRATIQSGKTPSAVRAERTTADRIASNRARVLAGAAAPAVEVPPLSEDAAQRSAVERAGELMRQIVEKDSSISTVEAELAEARHKLCDARMAVLPAFDVKYEVDENARVPLPQIAVMAAISGAVLKLLV